VAAQLLGGNPVIKAGHGRLGGQVLGTPRGLAGYDHAGQLPGQGVAASLLSSQPWALANRRCRTKVRISCLTLWPSRGSRRQRAALRSCLFIYNSILADNLCFFNPFFVNITGITCWQPSHRLPGPCLKFFPPAGPALLQFSPATDFGSL